MNTIVFRRYRGADREAVVALHVLGLKSAGAYIEGGSWDDDLTSIEAVYLNNGGEFIVGELSGEIVAMGALKKISPVEAEIKRMRVHPKFQRQCLSLDTTEQQDAAQQLYSKNGFVKKGQIIQGGFEVILFSKEL